ncbi:MAG: twin-arginine translocation signal domain-containing protein, partial [Verrucomicrobiae bacterium]|nr:twin-arginine translocation signal domain-containing protein [Verrucomicrobiae bacterium]
MSRANNDPSSMPRRDFLKLSAATVGTISAAGLAESGAAQGNASQQPAKRPKASTWGRGDK